jgi:hypothetical protein
MITEQTVGQHSHRVATLYCELWGVPRVEVLFYVLHHDGGELSAGDVPFGAKKLSEEFGEGHRAAEDIGLQRQGVTLPRITEVEHSQFKIADIMEMWETGSMELAMGNQFAIPIVNDTLAAAMRMCDDLSEAHRQKLSSWLMAQEDKVNG